MSELLRDYEIELNSQTYLVTLAVQVTTFVPDGAVKRGGYTMTIRSVSRPDERGNLVNYLGLLTEEQHRKLFQAAEECFWGEQDEKEIK